MSLVSVSNVVKQYGKMKALAGVNLELEEGKQYALQGASGSGKSTLLYTIGGLEQSDAGSVQVKVDNKNYNLSKMSDEQLAKYRNSVVGFVFQFHFLLPSMNCLQNILLPSKIGSRYSKEIEKRSRELASFLGVEHCLKKFPFELSGGEQQRINIIRALSVKPKLLLCDEPTGNLDTENSDKVTKLLKELASEFNATMILVTHDPVVAQKIENQITIRDGKII
tara:strand:+ start:2169 stop:2837 length:669 start_codon:yes stop_codon:yes gene_type:complete